MKNIIRKMNSAITAVVIVVFLLGLVSIVLGLPLMLLWNWLIPTIFGLKTITFAQAVGLNMLCGILFKGSESKKKED